VISVQAIVTSIELRNPTESQPIEITQFIFQSASYPPIADMVLTSHCSATDSADPRRSAADGVELR
jgi:hypothetical protein